MSENNLAEHYRIIDHLAGIFGVAGIELFVLTNLLEFLGFFTIDQYWLGITLTLVLFFIGALIGCIQTIKNHSVMNLIFEE